MECSNGDGQAAANWRKKTILALGSDNGGADLISYLLARNSMETYLEHHKNIDVVSATNAALQTKLKFPKLRGIQKEDEHEIMFAKKPVEVPQPSRPNTNTMEGFLKRMPAIAPDFCTAKVALKKQNGSVQSASQRNVNVERDTTNETTTTTTRKTLGMSGRTNAFKKRVIPTAREEPKQAEDIIDPELEELLTLPALKNADPKLINMINSEIICNPSKPIKWSDIAGLSYEKSIIKEAVVLPLLRPDIFTGLRRPPKGILLFGPPGTGKTLIGKCIASQSNSTFFNISSASLTSKWMGEGEKMVRTLFAVAEARQPAVIFIDEIDSLLSQRSENENDGTRRLKTEFLVRLDGAATDENDRVIVVGATNRPQELDEAVRRRFVKRLYVPLPEMEARIDILTSLLKTIEHNLSAKDLTEVASKTDGYSCADMESLCRDASMAPIRELSCDIRMCDKTQLRAVNKEDFDASIKNVRPSVAQTDLDQYVQWNKKYGSSC